MDIQNVLVYIIVVCCLLWAGRHFFHTLIRRKGNQTDVDADVVGATDVLHTRTKEYYFSLISKCHSPAASVS